jgi:PilZ domain
MVPNPTNQRSSPRSLALCPISINFQDGTAHGILRDISAGGIFFYSNFHPPLHASIDFIVHLNDKKVSGTGKVVRVEQNAPGAAIGIALQFSGQDVITETNHL